MAYCTYHKEVKMESRECEMIVRTRSAVRRKLFSSNDQTLKKKAKISDLGTKNFHPLNFTIGFGISQPLKTNWSGGRKEPVPEDKPRTSKEVTEVFSKFASFRKFFMRYQENLEATLTQDHTCCVSYRDYAWIMMIEIFLLNRKRRHNVENLVITNFTAVISLKDNKELWKELSDSQKQLCSSLLVLKTFCRQRKEWVSILISHKILTRIKLLLKARASHKQHFKSDLLFDHCFKRNKKDFERAVQTLTMEAELSNPESVMAQALSLNVGLINNYFSLELDDLERLGKLRQCSSY